MNHRSFTLSPSRFSITTLPANIAKTLARFRLTDPPESEPDDTMYTKLDGRPNFPPHGSTGRAPTPMDPAQRRENRRASKRAYREKHGYQPLTPEQKARKNQKDRDLIEDRKAAGLCVACTQPPRPGKTRCASCAEKQRRYCQAKQQAKNEPTPRSSVPDEPGHTQLVQYDRDRNPIELRPKNARPSDL